jgi:hypothetical protein
MHITLALQDLLLHPLLLFLDHSLASWHPSLSLQLDTGSFMLQLPVRELDLQP